MPRLTLLMTGLLLRLLTPGDDDRERGDIPGWVLITIMTAGLVTAVWAVAKGQLEDILNHALNSVKSPA